MIGPRQRDPNLWCEFHGTHDDKTSVCRHLREEVVTLLENGHLREFLGDHAKKNYGRSQDNAEPTKSITMSPRITINMIFRGSKVNRVACSATKKMKISVTHGKRSREVSEDEITFTKEDDDEHILPQNGALVISFNVLDFIIRRVLVYPESSAKSCNG